MWTEENRARYARPTARYESDLTDAEWAEIGPLIPPAKPGGNKRTVDIREVANGGMYILSISLAPGASGARCRRTYRRAARCTTILSAGGATGRWNECTMRFM